VRSDSPETRVGRSFRTVSTCCVATTFRQRQRCRLRGVAGQNCGSELAREIAALIDAGGQPKPRRGQGRSHRKCARPAVGAGFLWEGSSDPDGDGGRGAALGSDLGGSHGCSHRECAHPAAGAGLCGRGLLTPTATVGSAQGLVQAQAVVMTTSRRAPSRSSRSEACGSELAHDCDLNRSWRPAKAVSRPRPLPQEMRPTRGRTRVFVGGVI